MTSKEKSFYTETDSSITDVVFSNQPYKVKAQLLEEKNGVSSTAMPDLLIGWEMQSNPIEALKTLGGKNKVVEKYRAWQNLENLDIGQKEGHIALSNFLYSDAFLPLISAIDTWGKLHKDEAAIKDAQAALFFLNEALDIIFHHPANQDNTNLVATFTQMQTDSIQGKSSSLQDFFTLMRIAKISAIESIKKHGFKSISLDPKIPVPKQIERGKFIDLRDYALAQYESEKGTLFPENFVETVKNSKVLVVSLDWNSTWNQSESYANGYLVAITSTLLRSLANNYHRKFPDKQIFFAINTGRPVLYAWGVIEALHAIKELRVFGLAESGAVILKEGMERGNFELALSSLKDKFIPEPFEWEEELKQGILKAIQDNLFEGQRIHNEDKKASLALRIFDHQSKNWIHLTKDKQQITPEYLKNFVELYLSAQIETINNKKDPQKLQKLERRIKILSYMKEKLAFNYNPTAGFLDLVHKDINKYSSLKLVLEQFGLAINECAIIHIGDSNSDKMPEDNIGPGEVNEGADDVLLVGVGNSSSGYKQVIEKRISKGRGLVIPRNTVLGLMDMLTGMNNLINQINNTS